MSDYTWPHDYRDRIIDEASNWFVRMQEAEVTQTERKAFADWLAASAEHIKEYLQLHILTQDLQELPSVPVAEELIRAAQCSQDQNVISLLNSLTRPARITVPEQTQAAVQRKRWPRLSAAIAATLLITAVALPLWHNLWSANRFKTEVGEQKSFSLRDGSIVAMNAQSKIRVAFSDTYRTVYLYAGEALFDVAKDPQRPFRVYAGGVEVKAVGTAFNIYNRPAGTTVTVTEGTVAIIPSGNKTVLNSEQPLAIPPADQEKVVSVPVQITQGQQAQVDTRTRTVAVRTARIDNVMAWRQRRLIFVSQTLAEAVQEFNRYNETPLSIADDALANIKINGVFSADDQKSFALFLRESGLATYMVKADGTIALQSVKN